MDTRRADNLRAAGLTVLAVTLFTVSDAVVKSLAVTYPPGQIMACRGLGSALLLALLVGRRVGGAAAAREALRDPACWTRALFEVGGVYCFLTALARLPLADATALLFVFPVLLVALAAGVLRERVGAARWAAVAAGLGGALVILRPGTAAFEPAMLWPLAAALCVAGRDLATRFVAPGASSGAVALLTTCVTAAAGLATLALPVAAAGWRPVDAAGLLGLAASAALVAAAFLALVEGTRSGDVSFTAPLRYVVIPLSFLIGWLVWGQFPDGPVVLGAAVVAASGLLVLRREGPPRHPAAGEGAVRA